jgi:predicted metal-dependent phosphoesterase TrpH
MPKMIRFEMHLHSVSSHDSLMQPAEILEWAARLGIDKVAITDHNAACLGLKMQQLFPEKIIAGEEVMTTKGELLAYFIQEEIPAGLSPEEAIYRLKDQGAFISVAHPFERQRNGWSDEDLRAILPMLDAIEVFNARCLNPATNTRAMNFARENHLPGTAGSDAHTLSEIGTALVRLPDFHDAAGLRESLKSAEYETRLSSPWVHFGSRWAAFIKNLGLGKMPNSIDE